MPNDHELDPNAEEIKKRFRLAFHPDFFRIAVPAEFDFKPKPVDPDVKQATIDVLYGFGQYVPPKADR